VRRRNGAVRHVTSISFHDGYSRNEPAPTASELYAWASRSGARAVSFYEESA
jgi:hypothetical protein